MAKNKNAHAIGNPLPLRIIKAVYPTLEKIFPKLAHKLSYNLFFTPIKYKTPERELDILTRTERFSHKVNNKQVQFYQWGDKANPTIVLVHGWMGRATQFFKLIDQLVVTNHHVVSFDGPAHGASSGRQTNMNEFAECIEHIAEKFGSINCAIGHSFGGITILNTIRRGLDIEKVGLVATPSIASDIITQFEARINASPATGESFRNEVFKRYGIEFDMISAGEMIKSLSIKCLLLVHDENDRDVPFYHAELMLERCPSARTIFTSGMGHTRILRNDEVIGKMIKIITSETVSES
ncbi:MAG: alpha/beta hydrolase [Bacteroidota bacterium]